MERWRFLLTPFSWIYAAVIGARNNLYDMRVLKNSGAGCPVISVGNITTGGTGKTPVVEFLISYLQEQGAKTALLSRGYGRETTGTVTVSDGGTLLCGPAEAGDEPVQVARKFPRCVVVVDEDRVRGARFTVGRYAPDVIVLDDGFQHRSLRRDLDIVVLDGSRDVSAMPMLPAGNRREPLSSLERAHFFIRNRFTDASGPPGGPAAEGSVEKSHPGTPFADMKYAVRGYVQARTGEPVSPELLRAGSITAFCGVGHPASFRELLDDAGLLPAAFLEFPDHHRYTVNDFSRISGEFRRTGSTFVVTTEKDAVRIGRPDTVAGDIAGVLVYPVIGAEMIRGGDRLKAALNALGVTN